MRMLNKEMKKLWDEIRPWMDGAKIVDDAPVEAKKKAERIKEIIKNEEEKMINMM